MHALVVAEDEGAWTWYIKDQAEHNDVLTTHPYPYYTPHSHRDRITANRVVQFPAAQSALYSDIGGKPCLTQELGLLGPMIADEARDEIRVYYGCADTCIGLATGRLSELIDACVAGR